MIEWGDKSVLGGDIEAEKLCMLENESIDPL
jgi:hypothetical protein